MAALRLFALEAKRGGLVGELRLSLRRARARALERPLRRVVPLLNGVELPLDLGDIVKDVRGSESNCEQDSRKM